MLDRDSWRRLPARLAPALAFAFAMVCGPAIAVAGGGSDHASDDASAETALTVTSSKAPPSRAPAPQPVAAAPSSEIALAEQAEPEPDPRFAHRGFVVDANVGVLGCLATTCARRHAARPGVHVGGFLGGNIRGWVSIGLGGGWGTVRPQTQAGTDALGLYGLDATALMADVDVPEGYAAPMGLDLFAVRRAQIRAVQAGPLVRVHFIPRGRMTAWVGSGAHYNFVSSEYDTAVGPLQVQLHGLAIPIEAGLGVYLAEHVALTAQFDYLWSWYALTRIVAPTQDLMVPVSMLDDAGREQGAEFAGGLPHFWSASFGVRARI
ncbi:MAG: hypothetical protein AAF721_37305 [Myxococcota bacterium]